MGSRLILHRILCLVAGAAAATVLFSCACADPAWPDGTEAQRQLKEYVEMAGVFLREQGEMPVNSLFEAYTGFEVFGITDQPDAEMPEGVEITAQLFRDSINSLQIRVNYIPRFPQIAAAFIRALNPEGMTMQEARAVPERRTKEALQNPGNSFEDEVEELNGTSPHIYYAYYPNQYRDGVSWIQMTIIFPISGTWNGQDIAGGEAAAREPGAYGDTAEDYDGYYSDDDYSHYEFFITPTPEPDSAAGNEYP